MSLNVKPTYKAYDDEFRWADENDPVLAAEIKEYESREKYENRDAQTLEEYHRLFEMNVESRKQHRFANQEELKLHREGRILHMNEFMHLLRSAGVDAWFSNKGGMAKTLGLYLSHEGLKPTCTHKNGESHYVGFVQVPYMQEYEELFFDRYDVPLGIKRRGWRTILLKLIEQGILTETQAHETFSAPQSSIVSRRYLQYLKYLRDKKTTG